MSYLLGIDAGTNRIKSALFTTDGTLKDITYAEQKLSYPRKGWVEQSALDWWTGLRDAVRLLVTRNNARNQIVAMSLSAQGGGNGIAR